MKIFSLIILGVVSLFLVGIASANSSYGSIDVFYNDKLLPGKEVAKPLLKIDEPFKIRVHLTVYQKCYVSVKLSELDKNIFTIIKGPTSNMEEYYGKVMEKNSTEIFEWDVKPTEKWSGGSIPIDFIYQIDELGAGGKTLVNSGFTVAYCTISNEHYEEENPESENQPVSGVETPAEIKSPSPSVSAPAFTFIGSIFTTALVSALARKKL